MKKRSLLILALVCVIFFTACEKDRTNPSPNPAPAPSSPSRTLIVGNEGSFGTNTASISTINLSTNTVSNNVYKTRNSQDVGDVLQSFTRINDYYYFLVNNSNKILVTDTNFNKKSVISGIQSPRFIKAVSATRAYVTSLFNDKIYIVDLLSNTKISEIKMDYNWTEQMALAGDATGNYIYVCENDTAVNYITKIQVSTNQVVDKITIAGSSPSQIALASDGNLWVLAGNNYYGKVSTLTEVDPRTNSVEQSFTFPASYTTGQMAIGPNNEKYVAVVDYATSTYGVYKFDNTTITFPSKFFINKPSGANFYGLTVDPSNGDVYVSDSKGFTQAGAINKYSSTGALLDSWTTAIGPSSFYFVQ